MGLQRLASETWLTPASHFFTFYASFPSVCPLDRFPLPAPRALPAAGCAAVAGACACLAVNGIGEPNRGKPYVRFDEGALVTRVWQPYTGTKPETADTAKGSLPLGLPGSTLPNPTSALGPQSHGRTAYCHCERPSGSSEDERGNINPPVDRKGGHGVFHVHLECWRWPTVGNALNEAWWHDAIGNSRGLWICRW